MGYHISFKKPKLFTCVLIDFRLEKASKIDPNHVPKRHQHKKGKTLETTTTLETVIVKEREARLDKFRSLGQYGFMTVTLSETRTLLEHVE